MSIKKPDPLPDFRSRFMMPDGTPSEDFFRWLQFLDRVLRQTVDFANTPNPVPQFEMQEQWPFGVAFVEDGDYVIIQNNDVERTIGDTVSDCDAGTCTATFKINTTALGGSANSVSTSEQVQAHSSANVLGVGDDLVVTISSSSNCEKMRLNVKTTRTITAS